LNISVVNAFSIVNPFADTSSPKRQRNLLAVSDHRMVHPQ
jgi:hypothetical protein